MAVSLSRSGRGNVEAPGLAPEDLLRKRIITYTFLRILLSTILFGLASYLVVRDPDSLINRSILFYLAGVTYVFLGISAGIVHRVQNLVVFVALQLLFDVSLITTLVQATGGIGSFFFVLYFMNIVAGAYLGYGPAALAIAGIDAVAFLTSTGLTMAGLIPGEKFETGASFFADAALRVSGFLLVGLLTGRLAERVLAADHALVLQREKARALEEEFGLIIQSVPSGILIIDPKGVVKGANPAAMSRVGLCEGWSIQRVLPGFREEGGSQEVQVRGPGGSFTLLCQSSPLGDQGGQVIVLEDVTRLREMEAEIEREERLVGVGRIAAAIAHEIRNPLASLSGCIQLLQEENPGPVVDIALREINRLTELVGDFLDTARPPRLLPRPTKVVAVARDVATALHQDPRYKGLIVVQVEGDQEIEATLDPNRFRQILWNLVLNGAQAMPDGGVVRVACLHKENRLVVEVSDSGVGIDKAHQAKLFDPFYTTRQGGTGLGLATVHRLVRSHAGTITLRSEPGSGTTFQISFPQGIDLMNTQEDVESALTTPNSLTPS